MIGPESGGYPVVHDHAILSAHNSVAHRANLKIVPVVGVNEVQKFDHVGPLKIDFPKWGDIDDADMGSHILCFRRWIPVMLRTNPLTGNKRYRTMLDVPRLHW